MPESNANRLHELNLDLSVKLAIGLLQSPNAIHAARQLPDLLRECYTSIANAATPETPEPVVDEPVQLKPAVPIKRSVTADYIICLENGRKFKSLKRHLMASHQMTPEQYREKWNLPADYPMVAPNYAATRSNLAKANGLGRK